MPAKGKRAMQNEKRIEKNSGEKIVGKEAKRIVGKEQWEKNSGKRIVGKEQWEKDSRKEAKERFESKGIKKIDCKEEDICPAIGIFAVQINQQL